MRDFHRADRDRATLGRPRYDNGAGNLSGPAYPSGHDVAGHSAARVVAGVIQIDAASADAPPELKTRARLEPGSAAYLEDEPNADRLLKKPYLPGQVVQLIELMLHGA
jgi:hypothetical protein